MTFVNNPQTYFDVKEDEYYGKYALLETMWMRCVIVPCRPSTVYAGLASSGRKFRSAQPKYSHVFELPYALYAGHRHGLASQPSRRRYAGDGA